MNPQGTGYAPSPQQGAPPPEQQYQKPVFNQDELRVLRECNLESFYYRSLPMAAGLTVATYLAMRKGYLKISEKYGFTPKLLGAAFAGYFGGKISYQNTCAEKLMRLPNSPVGEVLRKRKGRMGFQESLNMEPGFTIAMNPNESGSSHPNQQLFEDYIKDSSNEGLDDYERGVTDSLTPYSEITPSSSQQFTSYEDLRRQNREEHVNRMAEKYRRPTSDAPLESGLSNIHVDETYTPPPSPSRPPVDRRVVRKNQYGDDIVE